MTIDEIEKIPYRKAIKIAAEVVEIKEHNCMFIELGGRYGYSVLVFKNRKHIYYANDYELHHGFLIKQSGREALKQYYIDNLSTKLYTDTELLDDIQTYKEYTNKNHFLRNYWIMQYDYVTGYCIGIAQRKKLERAKRNYPYFNPVSLCYVKDEEIIKAQVKFLNHLEDSYRKLKLNNETFREMIRYELANHEACITCDYSDALQSLGLTYDGLTGEQKKIVKEELKKQFYD